MYSPKEFPKKSQVFIPGIAWIDVASMIHREVGEIREPSFSQISQISLCDCAVDSSQLQD
jgi:hypothetical protein